MPKFPFKPDDMYDVKDDNELQRIKEGKYPWTSPGTAPTFGNGCGAAGGSPYGCQCEDDGPVNYCYGNDDRLYGSCCGQREENVSTGRFSRQMRGYKGNASRIALSKM